MSGRRGSGPAAGGVALGGPAGSLIRQMSLHTPPTQRRALTRHASEDGWTPSSAGRFSPNPATPPVSRLAARTVRPSSSGHPGHGHRGSSTSPMRPRPVRVAWGDRRGESPAPRGELAGQSDAATPSELVAKRCPQARVRPRAVRSLLPSMGEAGLALSRQQLSERLRRAWQDQQDRQQNRQQDRQQDRRPSLDIFLEPTRSPGSPEDDEDALSSSRSVREEPALQSRTPAPAATRGRVVFRARGFSRTPSTGGAAGGAYHVAAGGGQGVGAQSAQPPSLSSCPLTPAARPTEFNKVPTPRPASAPQPPSPSAPVPAAQPGPAGPAASPNLTTDDSAPACSISRASRSPPPQPAPPPEPPPTGQTAQAAPAAPPPTAAEGSGGAGRSGLPGSLELNPKTVVLMKSRSESEDSGGPPAGCPPMEPPPGSDTPSNPPPPLPTAAAAAAAASAAARRLQFRNSSKTFISASTTTAVRPRTAGSSRPPGTHAAPSPVLVRALSTSSAPPATNTPVVPKGILVTRNRLSSASSVDVLDTDATPRALAGALAAALASGAASAASARVKSAPPVRARKLKTAATRRSTTGSTPTTSHIKSGNNSDSSDDSREESKAERERDKKGGRGARRGVARAPMRAPSEVVTMVSLLSETDSPADSEGEDAVMEADARPGAPAVPWSSAPAAAVIPASPVTDNCRKPPKSVWFQQSGVSLRRPGQELVPEQQSVEPSVAAASTPDLGLGLSLGLGLGLGAAFSSEKRAPSVSVEAHMAKRRLTRAFSEPISLEDAMGPACAAPRHGPGPPGLQIPLSVLLRTVEASSSPEDDDQKVAAKNDTCPRSVAAAPGSQDEIREEDEDAEPTFGTPKERECWELFKKMSEKGVSVSYDTVLRGMLTPTEYRMRRNSILSGC